MLEIDGSIGGGSIVRLSLGLSIATGNPFRLENVRSERPDTGLKHQHLAAVRASSDLSGAEVEGDELGSGELYFSPGGELSGEVRVKIPTAGSIGLLLQPLWIASTASEDVFTVKVDGGATAGKWAPPVHYLEKVAFPLMDRFGINASTRIMRHGFYPEGGALVGAEFSGSDLRPLEIQESGKTETVRGISVASQHLQDSEVAERQRKEARRVLSDHDPSLELDIETRYVESKSPGSSIVLWSDDGETLMGGDSIGEKGKRAEKVGREAAEEILESLESDAPLDRPMSDMAIPFLGLAGGEIEVLDITDHVESNIDITEKFVEREIRREGERLVGE
ncbi:MAG: RNA 3'-terminal phosphate cyclase [Candidatus Nanohaloarchaeota archaeon QJJ-7]|nr:RNA 3'-terminal phosphate cyclase [Candidatus Nanohaloarchaeota archaeon QJJ-7]